MQGRPSRRGLWTVSVFVVVLVLTGGAVYSISSTGRHREPGMTNEQRLTRARLAYSNHNFRYAEELVKPFVEDGTATLETRLLYGQALLELGRLSQARELFNTLVRENAQSAESLTGLGQVHERSGDLEQAIRTYTRASEIRKEDPRIFRLLGFCQQAHGDQMAAMLSFGKSLRLLPGQEDLSRLIGELSSAAPARSGMPDARRNHGIHDSSADMYPSTPKPRSMVPGADYGDPFRGTSRPDRRSR